MHERITSVIKTKYKTYLLRIGVRIPIRLIVRMSMLFFLIRSRYTKIKQAPLMAVPRIITMGLDPKV